LGTKADIDHFWDKNAVSKTRMTVDGEVTERVLQFSGDNLLALGGTANFAYVGPGPFAGDTQILLGLLFYLIIQHSEQPEYVFGNALQSSQASALTQQDPFVKYIGMNRALAEPWMMDIFSTVLLYRGLSDVSVRPGVQGTLRTLRPSNRPGMAWQTLTPENDALRLQVLQFSKEKRLLDDETIVRNLPTMDVDDPAETLKKAKEEAVDNANTFAPNLAGPAAEPANRPPQETPAA
jgi:hypothetical protein